MLKLINEKIQKNSYFIKLKSLNAFTLAVIIPCVIFFLYQALWASERFESRSKILIKQADSSSSLSPEMLLLGGLGVATTDNDAKLVEEFIFSTDMLNFLNSQLQLKEHYSETSIDFFSRLHFWDGQEDFANYFRAHVAVVVDSDGSIITIRSQGFSSEFAKQLNETIIQRSEWFINEIGYKLAAKQLKFISKEHEKWKINLKDTQARMLAYQQKFKLLDPASEGIALQSIAYNLEGQLAIKKTELLAAEKIMSEQAPELLQIKNQMEAITAQLKQERERLTNELKYDQPISEVIAKFSDLKIDFELALQAYTGSLASMEKTRVELYRQLKYLITLESATQPDESTYPKTYYNSILFAISLGMLFGVIRIIHATIKELS